jgi:hypothetical protein
LLSFARPLKIEPLTHSFTAAVHEGTWTNLSQYLAVAMCTNAHEAGGGLILAGGDCAVDFQPAEHALDAVALLVERPVNTPFRFVQITTAQDGLQKAALNQPASTASTNWSTPPRREAGCSGGSGRP